VRVATRRGSTTFPALVTDTIRADTAFIPYHWAKRVAANLLTVDALHPISKIPEYKVCACRVERGEAIDATPPPPQVPGRDVPHFELVDEHAPPTAPQGRGTAER
jgi:assimilatory nitrate reductase catalytic subunit